MLRRCQLDGASATITLNAGSLFVLDSGVRPGKLATWAGDPLLISDPGVEIKMRLFHCSALTAALVFGVASQAQAQNLITNGNFESGSLAPFVVDDNGTGDQIAIGSVPYFGGGSTAANGSYLAAFNGGDSPPGGTLSQTFTGTVLGTTYTVSYDYGTNSGAPQTLEATVFGADGTTVLGTDSALGNSNTLITNTFTFVADGSQATLQFLDSPTNSSGSLDGILDNVSVVAVPEPASVALLSLGGIALLARRRRGA